MALAPIVISTTGEYKSMMSKGDNSLGGDAFELRTQLDQLRAKREALVRRQQRAALEIEEVEKRLGIVEAQFRLAKKVRARVTSSLGKVTVKNADFQEAWIILQIAFTGPRGTYFRPDPMRGLSQQQLYKHLRGAAKTINESTFRSYLYRLKEAGFLWKHNGKWKLTEQALAEVELEVKKEEPTKTTK